uniref:C2H2-type domain-containing protein n=1 Tax=Heterorhabditis bacteriophora TaxID=37862 RepID=A0A1I7X4Y1_HETBA
MPMWRRIVLPMPGHKTQFHSRDLRRNGSIVESISSTSTTLLNDEVEKDLSKLPSSKGRFYWCDHCMAKFIYATSYLKHVNIRCDKRPPDAKVITLEEVANYNVISQRRTFENNSESVRYPSSCRRSSSEMSDKYTERCGISDMTNVNGNISPKVKVEFLRSHQGKGNIESVESAHLNDVPSSLISKHRLGVDRRPVNTSNNSTLHFFIEGSDGAKICVNGFVLAMYSKTIKDEIRRGSSSIIVDNDVLISIKIAMKVLLRCEKNGTIGEVTITNLCHVLRAASALDIPALTSLGFSFSEKELIAFPDKISPQFVTEFVKIQVRVYLLGKDGNFLVQHNILIYRTQYSLYFSRQFIFQSYLGNAGRQCLHRVLQAVITRGRSALIKDGFHKLSNGLSVALFEALGKNNTIDMDLLF